MVSMRVALSAVVALATRVVSQRHARLDLPLAELLAYPVEEPDAVDAAIQQTLAQCRLRGVTGVVHSLSDAASNDTVGEGGSERERDVAFCHRVRFVRHARQHHRVAIQARMAAGQLEQAERDRRAPAVDMRRVDELDYQTFFETYAERPTPLVVAQTPPLLDISEDNDASFYSSCFDPHSRIAPMRADDDACVPWLDQFHVPLLTVNNFVPRTEVSSASALMPALLAITDALPPPTATCPFGLHSVFVPVVGSVEFHLYDPQLLPLHLPVDGDALSSYSEVSVSADATASDGLGLSSHLNGLVEPAFRGRLGVGQTLFVPGGKYAAGLRGASTLLRFCVVDASNFNRVTETLRIDALVSGLARRLFLALQSPSFDASMTRRPSPSDTQWANYMQWPKETKLLKRRDMVSTETPAATASERHHHHAPVPMSRRERLKLWQDDKRWERHVASLTLPVPLPPVVVNATRNAVTLRWQDLYERPKNDITPFGYEVHWRREDVSLEDDAVSSGAINFTHAQLERSAMPTTLFGDAFDGKDIEGVVTGLVPDATYSFTIRIYVGSTFGVASEWSRSAGTASCALPGRVPGVAIAEADGSGSCVNVRWLQPSDDGGRHISAYVFALRYADAPTQVGVVDPDQLTDSERLAVLRMPPPSSKPLSAPVWLSGAVCDQIPGRVRLRVAAVNAMGVGMWSRLSGPMAMGSDRPLVIPTVRGQGDPAFVSSLDRLLGQSSGATAASSRPRVVLSDSLQQLTIANHTRVDVWAGHFSPRRFDVSSELVLADPLDASQPLRNAPDVRDRVVVIARGNGPFLFKLRHAQSAGALGVVFADVDGRCVRGFDQSCVAGATKRQGQGFGASDRHPLWREIRIPFVLALPEHSATLLQLLRP